MIEITKDNFEKEVLNSDLPTLLDFQAPWCVHCKRLAPVMAKLENELDIRFGSVNTDEQPELAERYNIDTIPSLILFKGDFTSAPLVNPGSARVILNWLQEKGV